MTMISWTKPLFTTRHWWYRHQWRCLSFHIHKIYATVWTKTSKWGGISFQDLRNSTQICNFHRCLKRLNGMKFSLCGVNYAVLIYQWRSYQTGPSNRIMSIYSCFRSMMLKSFTIHYHTPACSWHNSQYWFVLKANTRRLCPHIFGS